jgi:hypothetical protein
VWQIRDFEIFDTYLPPQISTVFSRFQPFSTVLSRLTRMGLPTYPHTQVWRTLLRNDTVRSHISEKSFWSTRCHQKRVRKEISRSGYLDVSRYSLINSIDLCRVFLRYVNISTRIFDGNVSCPGLYGGLYRQNLPYKFKKSYGDFRNRNFEKSHRTTSPRSDLRPDS